MPRACPVEYYARRYTDDLSNRLDATGLSSGVLRASLHGQSKQPPGCHGLVPWSITRVATPTISATAWMPRACPVEYYACRYTDNLSNRLDATGLSRGGS